MGETWRFTQALLLRTPRIWRRSACHTQWRGSRLAEPARMRLCAELWPGVLDELVKIANARGGLLLAANRHVRNWITSTSLRAGTQVFVGGRYYERSLRANRGVAARHVGFLRKYDIFTDEELKNDPMYCDLLWPVGLGWCAATIMRQNWKTSTCRQLEGAKRKMDGEPRVLPSARHWPVLPSNRRRTA